MRSVVLKSSRRCTRCLLPLRWCVCAGEHEIQCPLAIDVLTHFRERFRPSSTGNLIHRVIPSSRQHVWRPERQLTPADVSLPGRELWILHPHGEPAPAGAMAERVQVLLLDGSWRETSAMAQQVGAWGRRVSLPMIGASRYWLRTQVDGGRFSTAEALIWLLQSFGLAQARDELRRQFELHVYASLRARGQTRLAAEYLATSPLEQAFPQLLAQLHLRRPRE